MCTQKKTLVAALILTASFITVGLSLNRSAQKTDYVVTGQKGESVRAVTIPSDSPESAADEPIVSGEAITRLYAEESGGAIGRSGAEDNPADNLFRIQLSQDIPEESRVFLVYELEGLSDAACVIRSINDRPSRGGYFLAKSAAKQICREEISPDWLHRGENTVLFGAVRSDDYAYQVRHLRLEILPAKERQVVHTRLVQSDDKIYVYGFVRDTTVRSIRLGHHALSLQAGEFEGVLPATLATETLTALLADGRTLSQSVTPVSLRGVARHWEYEAPHTDTSKHFSAGANDSLTVSGSSLFVSETVLPQDRQLSIRQLRRCDLPALDQLLTNVTGTTGEGYRFLPHGKHFSGQGAAVSLSYDRTKIPSGYTEEDIRTFYFDPDSRRWLPLERIGLDKQNNRVVSRTNHFTDMINGVIKAPESPETEAFVPTRMAELQAADPFAAVNLIAPPEANSHGTASLQYALEMPPARNGMQPQVHIVYDSEISSGWLGEGWDIRIPSVTIDTRWGVPRYDPTYETETYSLTGEMLVTRAGNGSMSVAHRGEKERRVADRQFYTRRAGDFSRIIRKGNHPSNYRWEITDKQGTRYIYGLDSSNPRIGAVLSGTTSSSATAVIAEWKLARIVGVHGDWINYYYVHANESVAGGLSGQAVYLDKIEAGHVGNSDPHTQVFFRRRGALKQVRPNNARYGFFTSSHALLDKIKILSGYGPYRKELRSYTFEYKQGAYGREVLSSIRHHGPDSSGVFTSHTFDYYNDLGSQDNAQAFVPTP